jgi:hypothetical protein
VIDSDEPLDLWSDLFEVGDSPDARIELLRSLVRLADKDSAALQLLAGMLPTVERLVTDVLAALGQRN